jgi:hypothetical protein
LLKKVSQEIDVTRPIRDSSFKMAMKPNLQPNDNIDLAARELLKIAILRHDEIDAIAENPRLFSSVRARIISDGVARNKSGNYERLTLRVLALSAASMLIVAAVIAMAFVSTRKGQQPKPNPVASNPAEQVSPAPTTSAFEPDDRRSSPQADRQSGPDRPTYERAVYKPATERQTTRKLQTPNEPPMEFYALADLRASEEGIANGRVVRVELPKASLVALGVNIPLDSDKQLIKTDLLLGSDGVPRAIRLVE